MSRRPEGFASGPNPGKRAWRNLFSSCHATQHVCSYAMPHLVSAKETFELIHGCVSHFAAGMRTTTSDVRRYHCAGQRPEWMVDCERLVWIGDVQRAAQATALDLMCQRGQIDQAASGDIDDDCSVRQHCQSLAVQKMLGFVGRCGRQYEQ